MKIGVIGAGTMGTGIAQVFAAAEGYQVVLCDIRQDLAEKGKARIEAGLNKLVKRGKLPEADAQTILDAITPGVKEHTADCDLIVEAALERMDAKKELFQELQKICRPDTIFASNTSSLSITEMGAGLDRPVVGMHFFNPAPVMKLVEVVVGLHTPPQLTERIQTISEEIGKTPVVVNESAGFVVNRLLIPMINEGVAVFAEGVATAKDVDTAMCLGANLPMGPLALGDLVGLDVCLAIMEVLQSETGDDKYRPHPLLRKMVRGGRLGRKTGHGFFTYDLP